MQLKKKTFPAKRARARSREPLGKGPLRFLVLETILFYVGGNKMKKISILIVGLCFLGSAAYAGSERKERKPSAACGSKAVAYRPGGSNVPEAASSFGVELELFADNCKVQEKLKLTEKQSIYLASYAKKGNDETITYRLEDFSDRTDRNCSLTLTTEMVNNCKPDQMCDAMATFKYSASEPKCGKPKHFE